MEEEREDEEGRKEDEGSAEEIRIDCEDVEGGRREEDTEGRERGC